LNAEVVWNICGHVLREAKRDRRSVGRTKLVKLLYLIDYECYRLTGAVATEAPWRFWHYGPYCEEIVQAAESTPGIEFQEKEAISEDREFVGYDVETWGDTLHALPPLVRNVTLAVYREWGSADLAQILDYVYYETEPMIHARRGEYLDFSTIVASRPPPPLANPWEKLSKDAIKRLRGLLERRKERRRQWVQRPVQADQTLLDALCTMAEDEFQQLPKGRLALPPEIASKLRESGEGG